MTADVVVIGAGFAGLSAAVRLSDAGFRVIVIEAAPRLGGRASTFADPATGERVDNGQHVLFGCYRETYDFLRRLGTDRYAPLDRGLHVSFADLNGRLSALSCPPLPSPWHLAAGVLMWNGIPLRDRLTVLRLAPALMRLRTFARASVPPSASSSAPSSVSAWLRAHGQSERLCQSLWDPLAIAALNQSPDVADAAPFIRVLARVFGPRPEDSAIGVPIVPLEELYAQPAARAIEASGGAVMTKHAARVVLDRDGAVAAVRAGGRTIATRAVVSAVPWHALSKIWEAGCPATLARVCADATAMASSPIVTVNLWFDRPIMRDKFVGVIGGAMHWAFDKSAIFGVAAGHVSVVSSGADALTNLENAQIVDIARADLARALPETRDACVRRAIVVRERRATFSLEAGEPARPSIETPISGFVLAGDWVNTGLPATIESAVQSGHAAAEVVKRGVASELPPPPGSQAAPNSRRRAASAGGQP
jgi:squalene-associated FAD-dependent desaturase